MVNTFTIKFKDGVFLDPKSQGELNIKNWIIKITKEKIICLYSNDDPFIKYQVFSNGYFKLSKKEDKKWITIKKGLIKKPSQYSFKGYIILPKDIEKKYCIKCIIM